MQKWPDELDDFMREKRLSGPEAAELFGVTHGCLYTWLERKHVPPRQKARLIAKVLGKPGLVRVIDAARTAHLRKLKAERRGTGAA